MKTTTVRLDDDQLAMLELIAQVMGWRPSDVIRAALRDFFVKAAGMHPEVKAEQRRRVRERMATSVAEIRDTLGSTPDLPKVDSPAQQRP